MAPSSPQEKMFCYMIYILALIRVKDTRKRRSTEVTDGDADLTAAVITRNHHSYSCSLINSLVNCRQGILRSEQQIAMSLVKMRELTLSGLGNLLRSTENRRYFVEHHEAGASFAWWNKPRKDEDAGPPYQKRPVATDGT